MKKWLVEHLVCPECTGIQVPLELDIKEEHKEDVIEGCLTCPECRSEYEIREGIAVIVPKKTLPVVYNDLGYNSTGMLSAYLWSHFSEFFNGPDATDAYRIWASHFNREKAWGLDIGCSVGRLSLELSKTHERVIGLDTSLSFIRKARQLAREKTLDFDLIVEGRITKNCRCDLDQGFQFDRVEYVVADAMALPFRSDLFSTAAAINILEKVPDPLTHLKEVDRVMGAVDAEFLFSDPFSWDESVSAPEKWLSGRNSGPNQGRGMDNICRLMEEDSKVFDPLFEILKKGDVLWKIRKTQNLWEYITSQYIIGKRKAGS